MTKRPSTLSRSIIPSLASITIHAALFAALVGVTIDRLADPSPRAARISLESATLPTTRSKPESAPAPEPTPPEDVQSVQAAPNATRALPEQAAIEASEQLKAVSSKPAPPRPRPVSSSLPKAPSAPAATFAGMQAQAAERVVFAVDASGAMVTTFSFIQEELARSIGRLTPAQSFQIIFFGERPATENDQPAPFRLIPHTGKPTDLIRATAANRTLAMRWINSALPGGRSNPIEGLTAALDFDPDLIFFLARGIQRTGAVPDPKNTASVLEALDARNPIDPRTGLRTTVIKAVEFVEPDPTGLIERIARIHGDGQGSSKLITPESVTNESADNQSTAPSLSEKQQTDLARADEILATSDFDALAILASVADVQVSDAARSDQSMTSRVRASAIDALQLLADFPPATRRTTDPRPNLLRARAANLLASLETNDAKRRDFASRAIADSQPLRISDPATAVMRDTTAARARMFLGKDDSSQTRTAHDQLLALLRTSDPNDPALKSVLARAQLTRLDAALAIGPATPEAGRARNAIGALLPTIQDHSERALFAAALVRAQLLANQPIETALAPITDLYNDASIPEDIRRAVVAPRLTALVRGNDLEPSNLPLTAIRMLADHASWSEPARPSDAADLLEILANRTTDAREQADALRDAAFHARAAGQRVRSQDLYRRLAADHPEHPDAEAALTLSLETSNPTASNLARALEINPAHPLADDWRVTLAAMQRGSAGLGILDSLTSSTRTAATLALDLIDELLPQAATDSERNELLSRAATEAERLGTSLDPRRRLSLASAIATIDPDAAMRALDSLPKGFAQSADADQVRLEAVISLNQAARTFAVARDIAHRQGPAEGDLYWHAVTLWLELGAQNGGPDAQAAARAHVAGLLQSQPDLGGEPWRTRLMALAD